ncbi:MAG TPA: aspartyl/asparaginyl beta-hydroxylase domain-containing protein [Ramlibacter sp.]|nr:aspartyl/asparaginyl beta-hydroxylase domain-containing protein [Ramlibacter sp.]
MREASPFRLLTVLDTAQREAVLAEVLAQDRHWVGSPVPSLNASRLSLVFARSPHWISGPGVSTADARSFGTFAFVPELAGRMDHVQALVLRLQGLLGGSEHGSVFASRMEPGSEVGEHRDGGVYYASYHRCQVCLQAEEGTVFRCGDDSLVMKPGEVWVFDNTRPHSVRHEGRSERVALVVDIAGPPVAAHLRLSSSRR